jgi:UDP-N-acetylglucosamine 2-epimerase (non-hydrolysing)
MLKRGIRLIAIILGTRPEIIKMSPIIRECERRGLEYLILHSGQHYSYEMDRTFFEQLRLPQPDFNLDAGSGTQAEQTGRIMVGTENVLLKERPDVVLVQGDTNTTLAGALTSAKLGIRVGHVEAGLRSYDRSMPEEVNRVLADHLSDMLFAPTERARRNLESEGITRNVFVTGNTVVDAVLENRRIAQESVDPLADHSLEPGKYVLVTVHRKENVDSPEVLRKIVSGLLSVREEFGMPVLFPMHPRTEGMAEKIGIDLDGITVVKPIGYLEFLMLESKASLILTDSGGVQEEACILRVPCVTLRENTERPETVEVGSNVIAGRDPSRILELSRRMISKERNWSNPFGDGKAGERITRIITG